MACAADNTALLIATLHHGPGIASAHLWKTMTLGSSHQMQKNWISFLKTMAEAESLWSSVGVHHEQCNSAEGSAGKFSLEGGKSLSGETQTRAGKAQFKLYFCIYIDISVFLPGLPSDLPFVSSLEQQSRDRSLQLGLRWAGPGGGARDVQGAGHRQGQQLSTGGSLAGTAWPSLQPTEDQKALWQARLDLLQSKYWKSKPLCTLSTLSPRCQCLNLMATFRSINLFQRRWKWQLEKLAKLWRAFLRHIRLETCQVSTAPTMIKIHLFLYATKIRDGHPQNNLAGEYAENIPVVREQPNVILILEDGKVQLPCIIPLSCTPHLRKETHGKGKGSGGSEYLQNCKPWIPQSLTVTHR